MTAVTGLKKTRTSQTSLTKCLLPTDVLESSVNILWTRRLNVSHQATSCFLCLETSQTRDSAVFQVSLELWNRQKGIVKDKCAAPNLNELDDLKGTEHGPSTDLDETWVGNEEQVTSNLEAATDVQRLDSSSIDTKSFLQRTPG
ncbi:hypothetical protein T265_04854 [Opisthorchis viverrini]|uniref:Uncharacterized protein n=1 Tax=Opisthorchis viverrini TaxID=6198 RepID=A0A074ZMF3_OPIVI|nr:hypothetical protein T265_04854 [Opisthorchis viverrini]KER28251.1 hypothetical protein T265_04854 [Opisthorchis viverrini]